MAAVSTPKASAASRTSSATMYQECLTKAEQMKEAGEARQIRLRSKQLQLEEAALHAERHKIRHRKEKAAARRQGEGCSFQIDDVPPPVRALDERVALALAALSQLELDHDGKGTAEEEIDARARSLRVRYIEAVERLRVQRAPHLYGGPRGSASQSTTGKAKSEKERRLTPPTAEAHASAVPWHRRPFFSPTKVMPAPPPAAEELVEGHLTVEDAADICDPDDDSSDISVLSRLRRPWPGLEASPPPSMSSPSAASPPSAAESPPALRVPA